MSVKCSKACGGMFRASTPQNSLGTFFFYLISYNSVPALASY